MTDISAFFKENRQEKSDIVWRGATHFAKDGDIPAFVLRAISADESEALRSACTDGGKFDARLYTLRLVCRCVKSPSLDDAALQDSYGVLGAEALLLQLLSPGEYADLCRAVFAHNDFPSQLGEAVDAAKK